MDLRYFIDKFEAIPEELWCYHLYSHKNTDTGVTQCCAFGFCGCETEKRYTEEAQVLILVMSPFNVVCVNDGHDQLFPQATPKQRILAALKWHLTPDQIPANL